MTERARRLNIEVSADRQGSPVALSFSRFRSRLRMRRDILRRRLSPARRPTLECRPAVPPRASPQNNSGNESVQIVSTDIADVKLITPLRHGDARGFFSEIFREDVLERHGIT